MNTKFNIGDRVSYISGVGGSTTVFQITQIRIYRDTVEYQGAADFKDYYSEDILTLYAEPKKKVTKYLWAYQFKDGTRSHNVSSVFLDDSSAKIYFSGEQYSSFKRLDFSATEFEVEND